MQLVSACIASVAKGDAKLIGLGALGFPILMEAHVLVGVGSTTVFDIISPLPKFGIKRKRAPPAPSRVLRSNAAGKIA